jgi:superfamily II DNA or RNA helicase
VDFQGQQGRNVQAMKLSELTPGIALNGLEPGLVCTVVAATPLGNDAVELFYKRPDGTPATRLITAADIADLSPASTACPWAFDGDPAAFQLACEAKRIDLAFLFDPMMAVHTSNVDPLPHQITAVYESLLPRQPLRFVLADDPGAGKTIMAGLYIRELIMRADAARVLIVAPGSLVDQWRDELYEKFGLEFTVFSATTADLTPGSNPFEHHPQLICRLDQLSRSEERVDDTRQPAELQEKLLATQWDLVIFDEAHKLSASYYGSKVNKTGRFRLAERLGAITRHLLLMTATPHNGKEEDFQLFLSLLDSDRFYGKFRDGAHKVDTSDLMRRMVKEELVKFDNTPLFPERRAYTVNYQLSEPEAALYEAVTDYVKTEMGKADERGGSQKGSVGFALTALQRRLASSPEAIYKSLSRRHHKLADRLREEKLGVRGRKARSETLALIPGNDDLDDDDLSAEEQEDLEEKLVDEASAAATVEELEAEILILQDLEEQAKLVVHSEKDRKWEELSKLLQNTPEMHDAEGRQRKIIIFTEHRDTLNYLYDKIGGVLGNTNAIVTISGSTKREDRKKAQALFRSDPDVRVLIATDAAGEGVNLQCANLMVNYDLPWNPNRMEQRFGRIHRIGQQEVCHLWSLVAKETREGAVYHRLLEKLETECEALKGKVFNILGEVFEGTSLKNLLVDAIKYNNRDDVRDRLRQQIDHAFDHEHLKGLLGRNALAEQTMSPERLFKVKEEMEKAEARRLQPHFVQAFFEEAFKLLGGTMHRRELGRFEITYVPPEIRERDRRITGRNRRDQEPVLNRYSRVCFERSAIQPSEKPGLDRAVLLHPGHPLVLAITDLILERHANLLRQGAVFVDPNDDGSEPGLLFLLTHEVKSGDGTVLSKRLQFIRVGPDGTATPAGWAPHLDLEPLSDADRGRFEDLLSAEWLSADLERRAVGLAASTLAPEHFQEVAARRIEHVDKTLKAVHERLTSEIAFWTDRELKFKEDQAAGKDMRLKLSNVARTLKELQARMDTRRRDLLAMKQVQNAAPVVLGGALVIPAGLLREQRGEGKALSSADAAARKRIEMLAMNAVMDYERAQGCTVRDVSADNCGWDVSSFPPVNDDGSQPLARHIEVKGRAVGNDTITVTRNEILQSFNQGEKFHLAIVIVKEDGSVDGPYYVAQPFDRQPGWAERSVNFEIKALLQGRPA